MQCDMKIFSYEIYVYFHIFTCGSLIMILCLHWYHRLEQNDLTYKKTHTVCCQWNNRWFWPFPSLSHQAMHSWSNVKELGCFAFVFSLPFTTVMTPKCNTKVFFFSCLCLQTVWHKFTAANLREKVDKWSTSFVISQLNACQTHYILRHKSQVDIHRL